MRHLFAENHHLGHNFITTHHIIYVLHLGTPYYMPTRGTQYHLRDLISEMNPNIASIAKLLEELYTRFNNVEQELKSDRECLN